MHFLWIQAIREKAMETRTGKQRKTRRFKVFPGGREGAASADILSHADTDIVCHYGVAVQCTSIEGLELVEFEFLPDAA